MVVIALTAGLGALASPPQDVASWQERRVEVAGPGGEERKLARVAYEVEVEVSPEEAWAALADFGGVQDYVASITGSDWIGEAELGHEAARYCDISLPRRSVHVKERIFAFEDGAYFTYDVYDWTNFPLKQMHNTFGVRVDDQGRTHLYNVIDYKLKPALLTGVMRGQLRNSARNALLAFKHYLETGEANAAQASIEARYPDA